MSKQEGSEVQVSETATLSQAEKRALFATYDELDAAVETAKAAVKAAEDARSAHLNSMVGLIGAGPFARNGAVVRIVSRDGRAFLRGNSKATVEQI